MPILEFTHRKGKKISEWTNKDFVIYFSQILDRKYGHSLIIPSEAWQGYMAKMKGFRQEMGMAKDSQVYKDYIDKIFALFFTQEGYVPAFGAIVSKRVYYSLKKVKSKQQYTNTDFEQLRKVLYQNDLMFEQAKSKINLYE